MKKISILFLISFFSSLLYAQSVNLKWEVSTVIDYGTDKLTVPFFSNDGFSYENENIYYSVKTDSEKQQKAQN